jgi:uncharacterized protein YprB with RNaseH-like and TPR domain
MNSPRIFDAVCRQWRSRLDLSHDYSIVRNDTRFRAGLAGSFVFESEYRQVLDLCERLMADYEGVALEEALPGEEVCSADGDCYCVTSFEPMDFPEQDRSQILHFIRQDFTLVYGIGRKTELLLKNKGNRTIDDLVHHKRFGRDAAECLDVIACGNPERVSHLISRWHSPTHPLAMLLAGLYQKEDFVILDLETLGFFSRPIILIGIAEVNCGGLQISQYLIRDICDEPGALQLLKNYLQKDRVLVTYNGKSFDIPYLMERYAFYGDFFPVENRHYDLLHFSRRRWKDTYPDCRLQTLEQRLFNITRRDDVPGAMIPEFYEFYRQSGNPGPLIPIVTHNRQDLVTLARLFCLFQGCWHDCC